MKSIIVGTAGHIDHGKTALVKALTGIDADRLEEEKRRGITIDIGFAHLELRTAGGEALRLGFVDVPGHERFVRNMLAGIGGIDLVLLVIAADESIKPQTREHFDICRLLGVQRGIAVLSKSDLVDPETLEVVKLEVEEFLRDSFLDRQESRIVPVSARTGAGLDELKRALIELAGEVPSKDAGALPRLPIDRVFTMKGFGTVVTGTLISGTIAKDEDLDVFPKATPVRVRGIQVHGRSAAQAVAGERTALNLAGVAIEDLARGMTLAPPSTFHATTRLDVSLSLLPAAKSVRHRARVHFHAYTSQTVATVAFYGGKEASYTRELSRDPDSERLPAQTMFAQLRLAEPLLLLPGDRFIIRQFSPVVTLGGGVVLDASPLDRIRRGNSEPWLEVLAQGPAESVLTGRVVRRSDQGLTLAQATAETGWRAERVRRQAALPLAKGTLVLIDDRLVDNQALQGLKTRLRHAVADFHKQNPLVAGISKEALRRHIGPAIFSAALALLVQEKKLATSGDIAYLPGHGVVMKDEEAESKSSIENAFAAAGLKVPALKDVLAGLPVDKIRAQKLVTLLLREKLLVKISEELVFHRDALAELRRTLATQKTTSPHLDVARFKDLTGVSRKYAIPLLEYLDRERVTKRVGDLRLIL
jgi:selenocysteine-specific elongation factor